MENWDDLRILLAVVRGGSITSGAKLLGIDQSTASRRLQAYEARLGRSLFHDTKKRNQLTPFGEACAKAAQRLEAEMRHLDQELRINDQGYEGTITVQTGDILSDRLLIAVCADFLKTYPKINLRISRKPGMERGLGTDIALFANNAPREDYFGRELAVATFASYATPAYLNKYKDKLQEMSWLNWDDGSPTPTWPALSPNIPDEKCRLRCNNVGSLIEAIKMGLGATILPCFIGESDPGLVRIAPGEIVSKRSVWLFVQPDLRNTPKISAFLDYLYAEILRRKPVIESS